MISSKNFFKQNKFKPLTITPILSTILYLIILILIKVFQKLIEKKYSHSIWSFHAAEFEEIKQKMRLTEEVFSMEQKVNTSNNSKYAIKIEKVGKVFTNKNGPFPAVNSVSMGIKRGSIFGFLGANGAGKTTLINMIRGQEVLSTGKILINGKDITKGLNSTDLSICPQFDDHLSPLLTGRQNLNFFAVISGLPTEEIPSLIDHFTQVLGLENQIDKKIKEMSGGNRRKCAVAVAFLSKADIILLDEPTASLDPVSRKNVHDLINEYRGRKTFMLTTHLLGEAESLCDRISIMIKGCIYAIGKPEYLSAKFGTSYNIDLTLRNDEESEQQITNFINEKFGNAELTLKRPGSRLYSIPSSSIALDELFILLQEKKNMQDSPLKFFTCSSSTLEKVFLTIIQLSEETDENSEHSEPNSPTKGGKQNQFALDNDNDDSNEDLNKDSILI